MLIYEVCNDWHLQDKGVYVTIYMHIFLIEVPFEDALNFPVCRSEGGAGQGERLQCSDEGLPHP